MLDREVSNSPRDETPLDEGDICPDEASENKNVVNSKSINRILFYFTQVIKVRDRQTAGWAGYLVNATCFRGSDTGFVCPVSSLPPKLLGIFFEGSEPAGCPTFYYVSCIVQSITIMFLAGIVVRSLNSKRQVFSIRDRDFE